MPHQPMLWLVLSLFLLLAFCLSFLCPWSVSSAGSAISIIILSSPPLYHPPHSSLPLCLCLQSVWTGQQLFDQAYLLWSSPMFSACLTLLGKMTFHHITWIKMGCGYQLFQQWSGDRNGQPSAANQICIWFGWILQTLMGLSPTSASGLLSASSTSHHVSRAS